MSDVTFDTGESSRSLPGIIDAHLHMVGNGSDGSGCWVKLNTRFRLQAAVLMRSLRLPQSALHGPLESLYIERIMQYLRSSSVRAAVLLAHEVTRDENGIPIPGFGTMYIPNEAVIGVSKKNPGIFPGVSIHPARPDALEELERCLTEEAVLMKCLPNCQNIDLSDRRFIPFFERMAEAGLPLLAHTGGELSLPVYNKHLASPERLILPLECGVKVIAAHCGTSSLLFDKDYSDLFAKMLQKYPNLYGDNSGMMTPVRCRHLRRVLQPPVINRVVYGSDIPIPISSVWPRMWGLISGEERRALARIKNPIELDFQIKRAMGFSDASFRRGADVLRLSSRQRMFVDSPQPPI